MEKQITPFKILPWCTFSSLVLQNCFVKQCFLQPKRFDILQLVLKVYFFREIRYFTSYDILRAIRLNVKLKRLHQSVQGVGSADWRGGGGLFTIVDLIMTNVFFLFYFTMRFYFLVCRSFDQEIRLAFPNLEKWTTLQLSLKKLSVLYINHVI